MPARKLIEFLNREHVRYDTIEHSPAFTAQEIAATAHIPGRELAKTVVVDLDGRKAMAVLPANHKIALPELQEVTGGRRARFATEDEMKDLFPDCETGAMPPFGNLYGMDVYVSPELAEDDQIFFNAGSHTQLIKMPYREFDRLVHPRMASFAA
jgi:Ala-tRNA(Pro) deacylase